MMFMKLLLTICGVGILTVHSTVIVPGKRVWQRSQTFDSIVADFGLPLEDNIRYQAYLNFPPHSFESGEINDNIYLCNTTDYSHWLLRRSRSRRMYQSKGTVENYRSGDQPHRALLVKEGKCSVEEKFETATYINRLYEEFKEDNEWVVKSSGTNIVEHLILFGDNEMGKNSIEEPNLFPEDKFPMSFLHVSSRDGNRLLGLIASKYASAKNGVAVYPEHVGIKVLLDSSRLGADGTGIDQSTGGPFGSINSYLRSYFLLFMMLGVLVFLTFLSRLRCRRHAETNRWVIVYVPQASSIRPSNAWFAAFGFVYDQREMQANAADTENLPDPVTKEEVLSLPDVVYSSKSQDLMEGGGDAASVSSGSAETLSQQGELHVGEGISVIDDSKIDAIEKTHIPTASDTETKKNVSGTETNINIDEKESKTNAEGLDASMSGRNQNFVMFQNPTSCSICLDDFQNGETLKKLPCGHMFHFECVLPWLTERQNVCPLCKVQVFERKDGDAGESGSDTAGDATTNA